MLQLTHDTEQLARKIAAHVADQTILYALRSNAKLRPSGFSAICLSGIA